MPDIKDEYDAQLIAWVGRFMFDRVIEDERFTLFPTTRLGTNPKPAAIRYNQGQVANEPGVVDAHVGRNVSIRCK